MVGEAAARRARASTFVRLAARRWPSTNYSAPTGAASRTPCAARRRAGRSRTRAWRGPAQLFAGRGALSCLLQCCAAVLPRPVNLRQSAIRARAISRRSESCCNVLIAAVTALRDGCKLVAGRCRRGVSMLRRPHVHQRLRRERRPNATLGATSRFSLGLGSGSGRARGAPAQPARPQLQ